MKKAIVTGCSGQLGRAYCEYLINNDYDVIGIDIQDSLQVKNESLAKMEYHQVDITKNEEITTFFEKIKGPIDLLINNAGVSCFSPFEERSPEEIDFVMDVNLKAPILMAKEVFNRFMKDQKSGKIINIGSIYGQVSGDMRLYRPGDRRTPEIYGATKAAIINVTKYLAAYMAPYNIQVNCLSPGGIFNNQSEYFIDKYEEKVPMKRMGTEQDLIPVLKTLIDPDSAYMTGQNITVDGGFTAW